MNMHVTIRGGPELAAKLGRLSAAAAGEALENALVTGALKIVNAAQEKAPWLTGNLRRSIHVGGHADESLSVGLSQNIATRAYEGTEGTDIGGNKHSRTKATVLVGTNVEYAKIQEYGGTIKAKNAPYLRFRTKDGSWHTVKSVQIPAHPYLRPALDEKKGDAVRVMGEALRDQLRYVR
jgi:HK97 gp10 family phage protein